MIETCELYFILEYGLEDLDTYKLGKMLNFANAAASIASTRKKNDRGMPKIEEINELLQSR